jgi:hypothetical protein
MNEDLKTLLGKLTAFAKVRMGFKNPPRLFLRKDEENSQKMLGRTAHYDPEKKSITIFIQNRHPKDILRSFSHELVHHIQNLRGDLSHEKCGSMGNGYAQDNEHMRNMEKEAYLQGNMCFRDWEDTLDNKDIYIMIKLTESNLLKENKKMTKKITKQEIKKLIEKVLREQRPTGAAPRSGPEANSTAVQITPCEGECGGTCEKCTGIKPDTTKPVPASTAKPVPASTAKPVPASTSTTVREVDSDDTDTESIKEIDEEIEEATVVTPERESTLYEARFAPRNNKLFERLVKNWTK